MIKFIKTYFSPDSRITRIEKKLKKALVNNTSPAVVSIFCNGFLYLLHVRKYDLLSNFVISYLFKSTVRLKSKVKLS